MQQPLHEHVFIVSTSKMHGHRTGLCMHFLHLELKDANISLLNKYCTEHLPNAVALCD